MNGNPSVDQVMAEKVRAAAAELSFSASPLARSLVLGKTNTIAVVVPDLENPSFHGVLRGLSRAAARDGYHILIADSEESVAEEKILAIETRRRCDGLVLCAAHGQADLQPLLEELEPVVLVHRDAGSVNTPVVAADHRTALVELIDLLYGYGHRSLVYLAGVPQSASNARRIEAIHGYLDDHPDVRIQILPCGVSFECGYEAAERVLATSATGAGVQRSRGDGFDECPQRTRRERARTHLSRGIRRHPVCSLYNPTPDDCVRSGHGTRRAGLAPDVGPAERPCTWPRDLLPSTDRKPGQHGAGAGTRGRPLSAPSAQRRAPRRGACLRRECRNCPPPRREVGR